MTDQLKVSMLRKKLHEMLAIVNNPYSQAISEKMQLNLSNDITDYMKNQNYKDTSEEYKKLKDLGTILSTPSNRFVNKLNESIISDHFFMFYTWYKKVKAIEQDLI